MTILTFCKHFPEALRTSVAGLVLVHTTYVNPVRTARLGWLYTALERPLIVPLLYLNIWLSPLVLMMNWLSYLNGTLHLGNRLNGFAGTESWGQVDFATQYNLYTSPGVLARGMLGMLRYDARATLATITVPTLVIPGDRDPLCPPEASEHIQQNIQTAKLAPLAPAKHMGLLEHNAPFAELVGTFASTTFGSEQPLQERSVGA